MTWTKRLAQLAIVAAILGVLAVSAGADWWGGVTVFDSGATVTHGHGK